MSKHLPLVFAACLLLGAESARGEMIEVIISRITGEVSLHNDNPAPFAIAGYSITSGVNALVPGNWTPIAEFYDAGSGGPVDIDDDWLIFGVPSSTNLAEGEFNGDGGIIDVGQSISLGLVWDTTKPQELVVEVIQPLNQFADVLLDYRSFDADFDGDLDVDEDDLDIWRIGFGIVDPLHAQGDANRDGVVDAADYTIWQDTRGSSAPLAAFGALSGAPLGGVVVPEPASLALVLTAVLLPIWRSRRWRVLL